jgi:hypothetical protein
MTSEIVSRHSTERRARQAQRRIGARKNVELPPEALYTFLASLDNHWLLTDRFVSLVRLYGPVQSRTGGEITIRGPWGLRRHARTWLDADGDALRLVGTAVVGRTVARVTWTLTPTPGGTDVELTASVLAAGPLDRALLIVGAPWLQRRFLAAIVRLGEQASRAAAPRACAPLAGATTGSPLGRAQAPLK